MSQDPIPAPSPTDSATTVLASGMTRSSQWGPLVGYTGGRSFSPLSKNSGIILGRPFVGKSRLIQSHPGGYIINTDLSSTSGITTPALMWPCISSDGQALGDDGQPVIMTYQMIAQKLEILQNLARGNQPRPQTIFFDSMATLIKLVKEEYLRLCEKTEWRYVDGRAGWDWVYDKIISISTSLKSWGYGVFFTLHMTNTKIRLNEDLHAIRDELTITDNFWSRLHPLMETIVCIRSTEVSETQTVNQTVTVAGRPSVIARQVVQNRTVFYATFSESDVRYICKVRSANPLPVRIELPSENAWASLQEVILTHQSRV